MLSIKTYLGAAAIAAMVMAAGASSAEAWTRSAADRVRAEAGRRAARADARAAPAATPARSPACAATLHQHRLDHLRRRLLYAHGHHDRSLRWHRQPQQHFLKVSDRDGPARVT